MFSIARIDQRHAVEGSLAEEEKLSFIAAHTFRFGTV
jgi:hypothetical protein